MYPERVLIIGAGPVGMTAALELARCGVPSLVLDQKPELSRAGARAIVLARPTLEAFRRLGCADEILATGVRLRRSRTFFRDRQIYDIEFPRTSDLPRLINIQQTRTERELLRAIERDPLAEVRFSSRVTGVRQDGAGVVLDTDGGLVAGRYAIACDGAHSAVRKLLGLEFPGSVCRDLFIIADVRAELGFANERRFFFDPPANPGRQVLMHPQPGGEWRIDWQVPASTDVEAERESGALDRRIRAVVGPERDYELTALTAYRFHQRLSERFRVGRILLAGDAAHLMAPFGARGLNSGIEDASNLAWKLALVMREQAPDELVDSYEDERRGAARANLSVTAGTARFMAPPTPIHRAYRSALLRLSVRSARMSRYVNDVRFFEPAVYRRDRDPIVGRVAPARPAELAPDALTGLVVSRDPEAPVRLSEELGDLPLRVVHSPLGDAFGTRAEVLYLLRPDGYVAAAVAPRAEDVRAAVESELRRRPRTTTSSASRDPGARRPRRSSSPARSASSGPSGPRRRATTSASRPRSRSRRSV